jgi:selenocysteine lyase/cysteine desulfurase
MRQGGTGIDSSSPFQTMEMPHRFEAGTHNYPGIASLYAGIRYIQEEGLIHIERKTREMTDYLIDELRREKNIVLHHDHPDLPVIPFSIRGLGPDDVGFILSRMYSVICRTGLHCAPLVHQRIDGGTGCVRLSLSCLNTMDQCRRAAGAIREVAEGADS